MIRCRDGDLDLNGLDLTTGLSCAEVRAALEGPILARAIACAGLNEAQFLKLYPGASRKHGQNLARIGRKVKDPSVRVLVAAFSFNALVRVARGATREEQTKIALGQGVALALEGGADGR